MKSTYCEYILEKILSTSEVGPILALIAPSPLFVKKEKSFACQGFAGWLPHFFKSVTSYFSCQLFFLAALPPLKNDASCLYCSLFERHQMI
jgi:hypothetical protein